MTTSLLNGDYDLTTDNLDIRELGKLLKPFFRFLENRQKLETLPSPQSLEDILLLYQQQDYLSDIDGSFELIKSELNEISPDFNFAKAQKQIQRAQVLEHQDYIAIYHILKASTSLIRDLQPPGLPVFDFQKINKEFKNYFREVELLFDFQSRTLVTYKHPTLKELDNKIGQLEKEIRARLGQISTQWAGSDLLQQSNYDIFDEKFVLPVRSDRYTNNLGRIIHRSKGGGTLYVEPTALRELSNTLEETKATLEREIFKLLKSLGDALNTNIEYITPIFTYILAIDGIRGRSKASFDLNLAKPNFNDEKKFDYSQLFHPLISDPIKNDLRLKPGQGMLISGPNTGGKTVLLKSICLSLILPHHGFFVPAKEADIYFTDQIHFMSHDNQSLSDGLSSFSSEAVAYISSMQGLTNDSIVFIDEIFNTTSSYEASLLATALIKFINNRGALTFISSHHESLKESVYNEKLLESAHMGFKKGTSLPTYNLHQGSPGRSFAREVFLRIEKEINGNPLISEWLTHESGDRADLDSAVQSLDEIKEDARIQLEKNKEFELQLIREKQQITNLLELERKKLQERFDKKWAKLKKETLDLTEKVKRGEVKNIIKVTDSLNHLAKKSKPQEAEVKITTLPGVPNIESQVLIKALGVTGVVKKIKGKKAFVEAGKLKTWVPFDELNLTLNQNSPKKERVRVNVIKESRNRSMKLDARGMRRDEFLKSAEEHILDVINGDIPFVDIIHGHGDGILKSSLKGILKRYSADIDYGHVEGNMGTTRVELKKPN